jgi:hypothetical protein
VVEASDPPPYNRRLLTARPIDGLRLQRKSPKADWNAGRWHRQESSVASVRLTAANKCFLPMVIKWLKGSGIVRTKSTKGLAGGGPESERSHICRDRRSTSSRPSRWTASELPPQRCGRLFEVKNRPHANPVRGVGGDRDRGSCDGDVGCPMLAETISLFVLRYEMLTM